MGKKILLADDSITIQKVIELTFSDEDFEVVTVGNGRLAIERLPEVQPDIVLCDIIMPEKDGYEVCEFVKNTPAFAHVPVLLLTGAFEPFDQERAARVGSDGHLAKPFEPQTLISKVKELLSGSGRGAAVAAAPAAPPPAAKAPAPAAVATASFSPARALAAVSPAPTAEDAREVTFIPEEPFGGAASEQAASSAYAVPEDEFYGVVEHEVQEPVFEPEPTQESVYVAEAGTYGDEQSLAEPDADEAGKAQQRESPPWVQPAVEVSWDERAQVASAATESFSEAPVFDEIYEPGAVEIEAPAAPPPPRPLAEPESIPPMLLEYEPNPEPVVRAQAPVVRPQAPTPPPRSVPQPSAADLFEEQAITLDAEEVELPARSGVGGQVRAFVPPPAAEEVSFADVAASIAPKGELSRGKGPSMAAAVPVPTDMVAQIAQRVVGQLTEKVIREVAWEILPDLAEALIKKEIARLTAELKER